MIQEFGGLTVLKEIEKKKFGANLIYLGDTLNFPYGPKSKEEIIKFAISNTEFLLNKGADIIVVACGTATSQALDILKEKFDIPIIRNNKAHSRIHKKLRNRRSAELLQQKEQ